MKLKIKENAKSLSVTKNVINVRNHEILVDEPKSAGGTDEAPTPVELLLAAFVGCFNITVKTVARDMGIAVRSLDTTIEGSLDVDENFSGPGKLSAIFTDFLLNVSIDCDASQDELAELLEESERRCAVSRTMKVPVTSIRIALK